MPTSFPVMWAWDATDGATLCISLMQVFSDGLNALVDKMRSTKGFCGGGKWPAVAKTLLPFVVLPKLYCHSWSSNGSPPEITAGAWLVSTYE